MIAKTILEQIGGRRFATMTGSKDFIDMGNGLRMSLARNKTMLNRIMYEEDETGCKTWWVVVSLHASDSGI